MKQIPLKNITLTGGFWKDRADLLSEEIIPYQWDTLNNRTEGVPLSHAVENFRIAAGESKGEPEGTIFQDSDVAKWIEAASYSLMHKPDPELEENIDELIRLIARSQHDNGYVNTFFTARGIEQRWSDLVMGHELYCAGHLMEAAVAYYHATGKKELIEVMERYADLVAQEFGPGEGQLQSYDGHPEIELALYRLSEATGKSKYQDLADFFVNIRGSVKNFYKGEAAKEGMIPKTKWFYSDYYLAHEPVREMKEVTGHAVRATYLYAGMADQVLSKGDPELKDTLERLWENLEKKRIYITGGIGSQAHGERFTLDYDLPADRGYTETCASIGLVFWAWRMTLIDPDSRYADMVERAIYNGALSGIAMDGKSYFYVNPLEVKPEIAHNRQDYEHVETHRLGWYDCACCPTNIARLIGSIGGYALSQEDDALYLHQYFSASTEIEAAGQKFTLKQESGFPWNGAVKITMQMERPLGLRLFLRKPAWTGSFTLKLNGTPLKEDGLEKGYILLNRTWKPGDILQIDFPMTVQFIQADTRVSGEIDRVALSRGPLLYCLEEKDNGKELQKLLYDVDSSVDPVPSDFEKSPAVNLQVKGYRENRNVSTLYFPMESGRSLEEQTLLAIPYYQWGNRVKDQEMQLWTRFFRKG